MIRAHRINATAQDDASPIAGWNLAPNVAYSVALTPGPSSCGVFLFAESGALVASGAALVGTDQPCVLIPQPGQTIGMIDAELGWHLLLTTTGTESQRTIRINPAVDLPDEIHPIYADDDLALVRATAGIDDSAHYIDDLTVSCPLGLRAGLGDLASVPVDGGAVVGQVESVTWAGMPNGTSEQAVIRRHVAIAPAPAVAPPAPPVVVNDTGETTADETTSGNVLSNDASGLTVTAVNGLSANVGDDVDGNNGGVFTIAGNGAWTFDPDGDFALLTGSEAADTSVTYHASDGVSEAMGTLTVTVSAGTSSGDPYWSNVELYIPMTGANNGTTFTDLAKGRAVTRNAPLITQTGTGPQSETSYGYYWSTVDTTAPQLSVPHHSSLNLGSKDFCADWFYRPTTLTSQKAHPAFFAKRLATSAYEIGLSYWDSKLYLSVSTDGTIWQTLLNGLSWSPALNLWYHMRLSRSGSAWRLWIGGTKVWQGSWTGTLFSGTAPLVMTGDNYNAHRGEWSICHFRLTVGTARETTDTIDVPTLPFPVS